MFKRIRDFHVHLVLMLVMLGSVLIVTPTFAAGITVDTVADEDGGGTGANCSLREAIKAANTDTAYGGCSAGSGSDTITLATSATYFLAVGQLPTVNSNITITGNSTSVVGTTGYRIFEVASSGSLTLNNLTLSNGDCGNTPNCDAAGVSNTYRGYGGAIFNDSGTLAVNDSTFMNNNSFSHGAAIYSRSGTLNVTNTTFTSNIAGGDGGGIALGEPATATITGGTFNTNSAISGGGISNQGNLTVNGSTFHQNTASSHGGGIASSGSLDLRMSSIHHNTANSNGGGVSGGYSGSVKITNSTIYLNTTSGSGGGIYNKDDMFLKNTTVSDNTAISNGGGVYTDSDDKWDDIFTRSTVSIINTILANNIGGDCYNYFNSAPKQAVSGNNNIVEVDYAGDFACATTSQITNDPNLGQLTGTPAYLPLNTGSPAIDTGDDITCLNAPVSNASQNGVTRPQGAHCDIGSYELALKTDTTTTVASSQNPSTFGQSVTFTATVSSTGGTPIGTVAFKNDNVTITGCGAQALSGGQATCMTSSLTIGPHNIDAAYSGDAGFNTSTGTLAGGQVVTPANTSKKTYLPLIRR